MLAVQVDEQNVAQACTPAADDCDFWRESVLFDSCEEKASTHQQVHIEAHLSVGKFGGLSYDLAF